MTSAPKPSEGTKSVMALRRGLQVLAVIQRSSAISFTELQQETGLPKATLARLLKTLVECGWVRRHEREGDGYGRYLCEPSPGLATEHGGLRQRLVDAAVPVRIRWQRTIPWPMDLGVREGVNMVILDTPGATELALAPNYRLLGLRPPMLRSSMGRCYLAFCPSAEREELLGQLAHSTDPLDRAVLRGGGMARMVAEVRARGYALRDISVVAASSSERYGAMSVPVFCAGRLMACLSCSWLLDIAGLAEVVQAHLGHLQAAALSMGRRLELAGT
jgi:IclR family mhp operon transcriptional activator